MKKFISISMAATLAACSGSGDDAGSGDDTVEGGTAVEAQSVAAGSTILEATKVKMGAKIAGEIEAPAEGDAQAKPQSDFYFFENSGKLRDRAIVRLENKSTTLRPWFKLYNSERSQILSAYDGTTGANVEREFSIEPGKGIYVEVQPYNSTGKYEISIIPQKAYDAYEANDDQLQPTTMKFGDTVEANIMDKSDTDWYQVTPPSVGKVTIALENLSATYRPWIKIYSSSKSQIKSVYDGTQGAGLDFSVDVQAGQDFYVEMLPYNSNGAYRLTVRPTVLANDMAAALNAEGTISLYGIYFDTDKIFVKPESKNTLAEIANLLKADPSLRLEVAGHTDNAGTDEHNMELSKGRAESVVAALVGQFGIDASRLVAKGYGESEPVVDNDTVANMARNRRVVLKKI